MFTVFGNQLVGDTESMKNGRAPIYSILSRDTLNQVFGYGFIPSKASDD